MEWHWHAGVLHYLDRLLSCELNDWVDCSRYCGHRVPIHVLLPLRHLVCTPKILDVGLEYLLMRVSLISYTPLLMSYSVEILPFSIR
jgi:hypothetical protein